MCIVHNAKLRCKFWYSGLHYFSPDCTWTLLHGLGTKAPKNLVIVLIRLFQTIICYLSNFSTATIKTQPVSRSWVLPSPAWPLPSCQLVQCVNYCKVPAMTWTAELWLSSLKSTEQFFLLYIIDALVVVKTTVLSVPKGSFSKNRVSDIRCHRTIVTERSTLPTNYSTTYIERD